MPLPKSSAISAKFLKRSGKKRGTGRREESTGRNMECQSPAAKWACSPGFGEARLAGRFPSSERGTTIPGNT